MSMKQGERDWHRALETGEALTAAAIAWKAAKDKEDHRSDMEYERWERQQAAKERDQEDC